MTEPSHELDRAAPRSGDVGTTIERSADQRIGQYVTRHDVGVARRTKPHLVESIVAEEPVTRCGRRLTKRERSTFEY